MSLNTARTSLGFIATMLEKYTPLKFSRASLHGIYNYLPITESITTSGQPTEEQFGLIREAGYRHVINLAPHNAENSLADEAGVLAQLGLGYTHIPVDFKNPTEADFETFVASMRALSRERIWVHCAANMRVSAFMYRYRCEVLEEDTHAARQDLERIWEPFGVWKAFVGG